MKYQTVYSYCDVMDYAMQNEFPTDIELIYVGSYFCDKYFCGISEKYWDAIMHKAIEKKILVALVIPTPSQTLLDQLKLIVDKLLERYANVISEVVVNDYAMLKYMLKYTTLKIWCGRTMSKDIRDSRYPTNQRNCKLYEHVCAGEIMGMHNVIYGVEVDVVGSLSVVPSQNVMLGVHVPLAYITFGRHCEIGSSELPIEEKFRLDKYCGRQCEKNWIIYSEGAFIKYGRTIYCGNFSIVKNIPNTLYVRWIKNAIADKIGSGLL